MRKGKLQQDQQPVVSESPPSPSGTDAGKDDITQSAWLKMWHTYRDGLTSWEKVKFLGLVLSPAFVVLLTVGSAGFWLAKSLSESKLDKQAATSEREMAKLEQRNANLQRQLDEKGVENGVTLENAKLANLSYVKFVEQLDEARNSDNLSTFIDQYEDKKVTWDCVILEIDAVGEWYKIATSENAAQKNQAFAQFRLGEFDRFVKEGDQKRVDALFVNADSKGILLRDCRFAPDQKQP